jgi:hypothetical protein
MIRLWARQPRNRGSISEKNTRFFLSPQPPDRFWGPHLFHYPVGTRTSFHGEIKWPGREADHSPLCSVEVNSTWSCTSILLYWHALGDYRRVLDCQLDLLDYSVHTSQHNTRLATAPQPVFYCNQLC